jgi:atypical dual specificity phosphatase
MKIFLFIGKTRTKIFDLPFFYVYSQAGVSRSATIVLAYLMTIGDYDLEKALQIVKGARGYIHPNPGFLTQLKRYHTNDVRKVR